MLLKSTGLSALVMLFLLFSLTASGQEKEPDQPKPTKLFASSEPLNVKISAPWKDFVDNDEFQGTYPAQIEFTDDLGRTQTLNLTVERRGITRQKVCKFPPVKLRFEKQEVKGTSFRGQKSLKLVTHCNKGGIFVQYYILEMLAYQMYNLITDFSFRVRPLSISYEDSKKGSVQGPVFGFLIEDDSDVAKRNGQKKLKIGKTQRDRLDRDVVSNMTLFQFMISNLDWAALSGPKKDECCHNSKLVGQDPEKDPVYVVPYDFDSSGLVNAKYAGPPAGLPVRNVTQRLYRGFCFQNPSMPDARQRFLEQEQAILDLITDQPELSSASQKRALKFIGQFFDILKNDEDFQNKIIGKCRK
jgi:hypothetical protein